MEPLVIQVISKCRRNVKQGSVQREEVIDEPKYRHYKEEGEEDKQHWWEQDNLKIIQTVAVHYFIGKKVVMLQGMSFKYRL